MDTHLKTLTKTQKTIGYRHPVDHNMNQITIVMTIIKKDAIVIATIVTKNSNGTVDMTIKNHSTNMTTDSLNAEIHHTKINLKERIIKKDEMIGKEKKKKKLKLSKSKKIKLHL